MPLLNVKKHKLSFIIFLLFIFTTFNIQHSNIQIPFFKISEITFSKTKYVEENIKNEISEYLSNKSIFFINTNIIKNKFLISKWVKEINLKKIFPNRLHISVIEFYPIAYVNKIPKNIYINNNFKIGQTKNKIDESNLIKINTIIAIKEFELLYKKLIFFNKFIPKINEANLISSGRWDLILKTGEILKLGRYDLIQQLKLSNQLLKNNSNRIIDLRNKKKIYIKNNARI